MWGRNKKLEEEQIERLMKKEIEGEAIRRLQELVDQGMMAMVLMTGCDVFTYVPTDKGQQLADWNPDITVAQKEKNETEHEEH